MKKKFLLLLYLSSQSYFASSQVTYTITIELQNVESSKGDIRIALFNSQEAYENNQPLKQLKVPSQKGIQTVVFKEIEKGEYAFRLNHDSNKNGKLDSNFLGIPKEGYAFSNNAKATMRPASFENAKFLLKKDIKQSISIIY